MIDRTNKIWYINNMDAISKEIDKHMGMVKTIALQIAQKYGVDKKSLYTAGMIGVWKALQKYDGSSTFKTYAYYRIRGEMLDQIRDESPVSRRSMHKMSVWNETKLGDDFKFISLPCAESLQPENIYEYENKKQIICNMIRKLKPQFQIVLQDSMNEEMVKKTCRKMKVSESYVCQLRKRGKIKLSKLLEGIW